MLQVHAIFIAKELTISKHKKKKEDVEEGICCVLLVVDGLRRDEYPPEFVFGASTSAYQIYGMREGRKVQQMKMEGSQAYGILSHMPAMIRY
ncbi:hypothetical protein Ahy_B02g061228 [Arachis hypogaea]|uniref:Uncharacterized protein n=1 Tax=Arachis hypogaea TaxID=3818 RepID=A0A445AKD3_ARAHY|nr:hypothetical protein Ahy_B02g061228 [Arachis hypogaea]